VPHDEADIYARASKDRAGAGVAVTQQVADCRELAARLGKTVRRVWVDNDISAAQRRRPRPGYQAMLAFLEASPADVLAWHADRLHRQPAELEAYIDLAGPRGITTHTVQASPLDLATASGRMVARMLGSAARFQVDHMSDQIRARKEHQKAAGKFLGGMRPFGYSRDGLQVCHRDVLMSAAEMARHALEPLDEVETRRGTRWRVLLPYDEAAELQSAARRVLAGTTPYRIRAEWQRRRVLTAAGYEWSGSGHVSRVLARARNAGIVRTAAGEVPAAWPAIITESEWRRLERMLGDETRRVTPGPARKWLGSGIYRCGVCGGPVTGSTSPGPGGTRRRVYRCRDASHVIRDRDALDAWVALHVVAWLEVQGNIARLAVAPADMTAIEDELAGVRAALEQLAAEAGRRSITARQLSVASAPLIADEARLEGQLEAGGHPDVTGGRPCDSGAQLWAALEGDLDRQRALLDLVLSVRVMPQPNGRTPGWRPGTSYFHPEYVHITRKM
jgi:site-specific DNA recombinase